LSRKEIVAGELVSRILCAASRSLTCVSGDWRSRHLVLSGARTKPTRRDDHSSRSRIAPGLKQPTRGSERRALANAMHTGRASPPLLFGLAPRGVFRAPSVATRAVGSYPTFSPLPNALDRKRRARGFAVDLPQGANHTGGIFSVALSVAATSRFAFAERATQPPGVTRRVALSPRLLRGSGDGSPDFPPAGPFHLAMNLANR
jgi:hypothetical protein